MVKRVALAQGLQSFQFRQKVDVTEAEGCGGWHGRKEESELRTPGLAAREATNSEKLHYFWRFLTPVCICGKNWLERNSRLCFSAALQPSDHLQVLETTIWYHLIIIWSDLDKLWQKSQEAPVASFASVIFAPKKQWSRSGSTWAQPAMTWRPTRWMRRRALSSILWAAVCGRNSDMNKSHELINSCFGVLWVLSPFSPKQDNTEMRVLWNFDFECKVLLAQWSTAQACAGQFLGVSTDSFYSRAPDSGAWQFVRKWVASTVWDPGPKAQWGRNGRNETCCRIRMEWRM